MSDLTFVYAEMPHQGMTVLRRRADGTLLDADNGWLRTWDELVEAWGDDEEGREGLAADAARRELPWPADGWDAVEDLGPTTQELEVVLPGQDVGLGDRYVDVTREDLVAERAAACGIEMVEDHDAVTHAMSRWFADCPCVTGSEGTDHDLSIDYNMLSSVSRTGRVVRETDGWWLVVCLNSLDMGDGVVWIDTWRCPLRDAAALYELTSSDDYQVNVMDLSPDWLCEILRAVAAPELLELADEIEAIGRGRDTRP